MICTENIRRKKFFYFFVSLFPLLLFSCISGKIVETTWKQTATGCFIKKDIIMEVLVFLFMAFFCFLTVHSSIATRKLYNNDYEELSGEVVSFDRHYRKKGRKTDVFYDIEVYAENGRTYKISTKSIKGRKYRNKKNVVILVPDDYKEPAYEEDNALIDSLINEWTSRKESDTDEKELISVLNSLKEINRMSGYKKSGGYWAENRVILKEERPSVVCMVFAVIFGMLLLICAIDRVHIYIMLKLEGLL